VGIFFILLEVFQIQGYFFFFKDENNYLNKISQILANNLIGMKSNNTIYSLSPSGFDFQSSSLLSHSTEDPTIYTSLLIGNDLYVGGNFQTSSLKNAAMFSNGGWSSLGNGIDGTVYIMHSLNHNLYIGGSFDGAIKIWNLSSSTWISLSHFTLSSFFFFFFLVRNQEIKKEIFYLFLIQFFRSKLSSSCKGYYIR